MNNVQYKAYCTMYNVIFIYTNIVQDKFIQLYKDLFFYILNTRKSLLLTSLEDAILAIYNYGNI